MRSPSVGCANVSQMSLRACRTRPGDATDARLVTSLRGAVEPLIHAPEAVQPARIGGIARADLSRSRTRMVRQGATFTVMGRMSYPMKTRKGAPHIGGAPSHPQCAIPAAQGSSRQVKIPAKP